MARISGRERLRRRREEMGLSLAALGEQVGDKAGGQIAKFERGQDDRTLPIPLAVKVSAVTGVPLDCLLTQEQREVARQLCAVVARDSTGERPTAA